MTRTDFEVVVSTNMCDCFEQMIIIEVCGKCDKLRYRVNCEIIPEHYGPYGEACVNTGQLDAGECWMCYGRRKKEECRKLEAALETAQANEGAWEASAQGNYKEAAKYKREAAEMQLVAGRFQYMFEHAQKCINKIDDHMEYDFLTHKNFENIQETVHKYLDQYTEDISKVIVHEQPTTDGDSQ